MLKARQRRVRLVAAAATAALLIQLAMTATAGAAPTAPFNQCPPVGADTSCGTLIVINPDGSLTAFNDATQGPFDEIEDTLIGVVNESETTVTSLTLSGTGTHGIGIFEFDGDGICSGVYSPAPPACPYGPTTYEGPATSFSITDGTHGVVEFLEGLAPGASTYFSLEDAVTLTCEESGCHSSSLSTSLSGGGQSGASISVQEETPVTDQATLSGTFANEATGTVTYSVYSDNKCETLVTEAGTVEVIEGSIPSSSPETLPAGTYYWRASYRGDANNEASTSTCGSEIEVVTKPSAATPTSTSTSLSGGAQSGPSITVNDGTGVTDQATLSGEDVGTATGSVAYHVFADAACTSEVTNAGTVEVTAGSVPASNSVTLPPGTYYWQATYSGDSGNIGSSSECGAEVETVMEGPKCTKALGSASFKTVDAKTSISNKLYTDLAKKQKLVLIWEHKEYVLKLTKLTAATCTVTSRQNVFIAEGPAILNGEAGYTVRIRLVLVTKSHRFVVRARVTKPGEETLRVNAAAKAVSSEEIS
jgi:hypothetical protein